MAKKILIVDDDKILSKILRDGLVAGGQGKYEVFSAFDGEEGFEVALREKPDLIMTDLIMPKVTGIEFLKKLRAEDWGKDIPVIMETQLSDLENMSEGMELGVKGYIIKSDYSLDTILRQVDDILK
ncbi:MAG: response regulator PhoP, two-component system, OmpR family, alkaline phosphatase synthesis response regulator PhoP [Parcubacteria group bacterium GW2011_GWC1_42_11]|uniref:PAS/PAC sensor hybrid histidine kinase n=1 Tax=Candidatus Nomurabacteria bacterium GW2011_GWC2_42_20 TaxID=1618756 RepID=A0A0G1CC33_9BACT|nr:MAG: response regulator PhoP, two-component system, OmpR family, alkaline phosphatase synthesis response regulator PhoP [Parcubacteria group bacterium GW2011_GWC1_42_11]KKS47193.1 MAG: PAS/PAC sensor hybrid histidine kinase [Candidatus Nomurabacteria bacterium GW2011_GWC2_42_20]KKS59054.1 MAG: PAS/PAC sensor hybrid histidine kinase [Candidatus Nomurabacteria bacterium GW2011_GWA2_42_41]KKT09269.1 MAG: PAS/PAC sensor hybrid histidine kinase [Candidatus Nomurabacteria bacterium GW2011_GWB1_43_2